MKNPIATYIFLGILLLLDFYIFNVSKYATQDFSTKNKQLIAFSFWSVSVLSVCAFILVAFLPTHYLSKSVNVNVFATIIGIFIAKLFASSIFLIDDCRRLVQFVITHLYHYVNPKSSTAPGNITRSAFLSWVGITGGVGLLGTLFVGFSNKYNYRVVHQKLSFPNLPAAFRGLKMVHISDIHSGSFLDIDAVKKGIEMINTQNADIIFFTGDLVNNTASEMDLYQSLFSGLSAPMGVFSVLGNHDYGDYVKWPVAGISKEDNLHQLKQVHATMGWRLLMNEHVVLEKNNEQIALIGIENWGAKARFPKYGKLDKAYAGAENYPFKILLSHDPSHWDAEVRNQYSDIDLTLSGHTHGMQFGLEIPGFKWSPIQYLYKQWAGLYVEGAQHLYVNRGFGFLGYPGRVGVMPEITVIEMV
jgi:hypothetical protein